jgi:hypothetical protein
VLQDALANLPAKAKAFVRQELQTFLQRAPAAAGA